ncbi:MAG: hypothetical protein NTW29_17960 [Bacteroidetes bacterium]|nr:hypothetical protein [Bacteroidota bacterium]
MFEEMTYDEWAKQVKKRFAAEGLQIPEEEELLELAYMECQADDMSIHEFVEKTKEEQG